MNQEALKLFVFIIAVFALLLGCVFIYIKTFLLDSFDPYGCLNYRTFAEMKKNNYEGFKRLYLVMYYERLRKLLDPALSLQTFAIMVGIYIVFILVVFQNKEDLSNLMAFSLSVLPIIVTLVIGIVIYYFKLLEGVVAQKGWPG